MAKKPYIIALEEHYQDPEVKQLGGGPGVGRDIVERLDDLGALRIRSFPFFPLKKSHQARTALTATRLQYYGDGTVSGLKALINNPSVAPTQAITLPGTPLAKADGTPEFGRITYTGAIAGSTLEITHHFYYLGQRDLEADGTLTNFKSWSSPTDTTINNLVTNAGGNGKIGDREIFKIGAQVFEVVERR